MTNEEARNQIEAFRTCMIVDDAEPYVVEALNMAIEALEQESCEDAISRQAVLDYIDEMPSELTADGRRMIRRRTLEEYISDTLPPVQPKQRVGMWIEEEDFFGDIGYKCSICNEVFTTIEYEPNDSTMNYCPNCGAKMQEVSE